MTGLLLSIVGTSAVSSAFTITDDGRFTFTDTGSSGADELSGLAYAGSSTFYAVSDNQAKLFELNIDVNLANGMIASASLDSNSVQLRDAVGTPLSNLDREGIIYDGNAVWIANEAVPELSRHDLSSGNRLNQVTTNSHAQLNVFSNVRSNLSWESLTRQPNGATHWTTNEEALTVDGPTSTTTLGTIVRLQKFNAAMNPAGQWAYQTEPIDDDFISGNERSGVTDLLALDGGGLLVLERSFGGAHFRVGVYEVDYTRATDVSQAPWDEGLIGETFTLVTKTELWSRTFGLLDAGANFEGMTMGTTLNDGSRSLILVADNGGGTTHSLYALSLSGIPVAPCDFDNDLACGLSDINLMYQQGDLVAGVATSVATEKYDLIDNNVIDQSDIATWLSQTASHNGFSSPFLHGDTDGLDQVNPHSRTVDITDFQNFLTGFTGAGLTWGVGNLDGDSDVDITDFSNLFLPNFSATGGGTYGPRAAPESTTRLLLGLGGLLLTCSSRRTWRMRSQVQID